MLLLRFISCVASGQCFVNILTIRLVYCLVGDHWFCCIKKQLQVCCYTDHVPCFHKLQQNYRPPHGHGPTLACIFANFSSTHTHIHTTQIVNSALPVSRTNLMIGSRVYNPQDKQLHYSVANLKDTFSQRKQNILLLMLL